MTLLNLVLSRMWCILLMRLYLILPVKIADMDKRTKVIEESMILLQNHTTFLTQEKFA